MDGRKEGYLFGKKNKNEGSPVPFHIQSQVGEKEEGREAPVNDFTCCACCVCRMCACVCARARARVRRVRVRRVCVRVRARACVSRFTEIDR